MASDYLRAAMAPFRVEGATAHDTELRMDYPHGGQVRLYGADNPDALRGIYLDGVVLDEYADMDPRVSSEGSPRARRPHRLGGVHRHAARPRRFLRAVAPRAGRARLVFADAQGQRTRLIPAAELELARAISPTTSMPRSSSARSTPRWSAPITAAHRARRGRAAHRPRAARSGRAGVDRLDLGVRDATAIWFAQAIGREVRLIDYYEASASIGHYVREIVARPYAYAGHIVPHDAQARELGAGKSRLEVLAAWAQQRHAPPMHRIEDGINGCRVFIPKCWFDAGEVRAAWTRLSISVGV